MRNFLQNVGKFVANFFIMGITWLLNNTLFFGIYFFIFGMILMSFGEGFEVFDMRTLNAYRILLTILSVLLILSFYIFFRIGKSVLPKFNHSIWTCISCFSPYILIATAILRSITNLTFTRSYLEVLFEVIFTKEKDFIPPLTDSEYIIWSRELRARKGLCYELTTSNVVNALFALLPFIFAIIGIIADVLCKKKQSKAHQSRQSGDG